MFIFSLAWVAEFGEKWLGYIRTGVIVGNFFAFLDVSPGGYHILVNIPCIWITGVIDMVIKLLFLRAVHIGVVSIIYFIILRYQTKSHNSSPLGKQYERISFFVPDPK